MSLTFIYKDDWLAAIEKPSGLLSVPGRTSDKKDCVISRLEAGGYQPLVVHRLDRDTSGVLMVAFDDETQRDLSGAFEKRAIAKTYTAIVAGRVMESCGTIDAPISKDREFRLPPKYKIDPEFGKPAITHWKLISTNGETSLLSLSPETGRSHQLRVHCQSIGHAILGDPIYGHVPADRLMLHAKEIRFLHPRINSMMKLKSKIDL